MLPRQLRKMELSSPDGADFMDYATRWEQRYSILVPYRPVDVTFVPVVDRSPFRSREIPGLSEMTQALADFRSYMFLFPVIAHYGTVSVEDIVVPQKFPTGEVGGGRVKALERILGQNIEAYVQDYLPAAGDWASFAKRDNVGPNFFTVLTDPEGRILAIMDSFGAEAGLQSEDPLSYLMIAAGLLELATNGGRIVLRLISKRVAREAAEEAVVDNMGREMVKTFRAQNKRVVVNIGGAGEEAGAINLNPNVVAPRQGIPNHIPRQAEVIGDLFDQNTVDEIVSNRLPPNTIDWTKALPGAYRVLRPGAKIIHQVPGRRGRRRDY